MNPISFAIRKPLTTFLLVATLACGGYLGLSKVRPELVPPVDSPRRVAVWCC